MLQEDGEKGSNQIGYIPSNVNTGNMAYRSTRTNTVKGRIIIHSMSKNCGNVKANPPLLSAPQLRTLIDCSPCQPTT